MKNRFITRTQRSEIIKSYITLLAHITESYLITPTAGMLDITKYCLQELDYIREKEIPELRVLQIKEKFGDLIVYVNIYTDSTKKAVITACNASKSTCCICGKKSKNIIKRTICNGWIHRACASCEKSGWKNNREDM